MRCLEDRKAIADVSARRNSQPANLRGCSVRNVVAIQVCRGQHAVVLRTQDDLLEDRIRDSVIHQDLRLPLPSAVRRANRGQHRLHLCHHALAKLLRRKLDPRLNQRRILLRRQARVGLQVAQNPALPLGHGLFAELLRGNLVAPFAEGSLGELLDISLVDDGHRLAVVIQRKLDRSPHQPLRPCNRDRLHPNSRIQPHLLLRPLQHLVVHKCNELRRLGCSLAELDSGVDVLGILAEDHHIQLLRVLHRAGHTGIVLHRAHALVQVHQLPQRHVQAADSPAHGRGQRSLDGHAKVHRRLHRVIGQPVLGLAIGLLAGQHLVPLHLALTAVGLLHRGVEDAPRGLPDVAARTVAFDERDNRVVGNRVGAVCILDRLAVCRHSNAVIARLHRVVCSRDGPNLSALEGYHPLSAHGNEPAGIPAMIDSCGRLSNQGRAIRRKAGNRSPASFAFTAHSPPLREYQANTPAP